MTCEKIQSLLCEYMDAELNDVEAKYVEKHVGECFNCLKELEALKKTAAVVGALPDMSIPKDFRKELSMKLENKKTPVFEIFTKRRFWLPVASAALAATFLIIAFNQQTEFLSMKKSRGAGDVFLKTSPLIDADAIKNKTNASGEKEQVISQKREPKKEEKRLASSPLKSVPVLPEKKLPSVKERKKENKTSAEIVIGKPLPEKTAEAPEEKLPAPAMEFGRSLDGAKGLVKTTDQESKEEEGKKSKDTAVPADTMASLLKTGGDDKSNEKGEGFATKEGEALPGNEASDIPAPVTTSSTGGTATMQGQTLKPAPKTETAAGDKEKAPLKLFVAKKQDADETDSKTESKKEQTVVLVTVVAEDAQKAYDIAFSAAKSYTILSSHYGETVTLTLPQNKTQTLIKKLRAAGKVSYSESEDGKQSGTVTLKIIIRKKEEK